LPDIVKREVPVQEPSIPLPKENPFKPEKIEAPKWPIKAPVEEPA
jgi:hypothetical protein